MPDTYLDVPVMTDGTGQDIVEALGELANVIQPKNVCLDIDVSLTVNGWSQNAPYTYEWISDKVSSECAIKVNFLEGSTDGTLYIEFEKITSGVRFVAPTRPTAAIPVRIHILNAAADSINAVDAELVSTDAIPNASNVQDALELLEENKLSGDDVIDGLNSTSAVLPLSANQGRKLQSSIDSLNGNIIAQKTIFVQLFNQTINGSASSVELTTFNLSSYIPSGYSLWSAEVQIQGGSSFYNLPWFNDALSQATWIERITNNSVIIKNKASWSANTSVTFTLHCKKD